MTTGNPGLPPPIERRSDDKLGLVRMTRSYELITPLFGGGAEPQKADEVTIVRGSEVRAQLRFWWRAMRGGRFGGDLAVMKACEDRVWGAPAHTEQQKKTKPTVQIMLTITDPGRNKEVRARSGKKKGEVVNIGAPESPYSYVAFPLREKHGQVVEDVKFDLHLTCTKACAPEVEAALWGWETFGGIGARTRRGFGAITCTSVLASLPPSPDPDKVIAWIADEAAKHQDKESAQGGKLLWHRNVPRLHYSTARVPPLAFNSPMDAWEHLYSALREFRQYRIDKKTLKTSPYGGSVWPEPDEIRRLTKLGSKALGKPATGKFPRAVFGLPIIFQFKDEPIQPVTLKPSSHDRLASPLILRPLKCANGQCVALAVLLKTPELPPGSHLELDGHWVASQLSPADANTIPPLNKNPDVLGAFLAWLVRKER
jgi:CRISPR-associated protein Cmr1